MTSGAGKLTVVFSGGTAVFHLGDAAAKWEARIRNPPSRLDKLGVKTGAKVRLIGRHDDDFRRELSQREAVESRSAAELVFLAIHKKDELLELAYLTEYRVWVIYPKGVENGTGERCPCSRTRRRNGRRQGLCVLGDPHRAQVYSSDSQTTRR